MTQYGPYPPYSQQAPRRSGRRFACIGCLGLFGVAAIVIGVAAARQPSSPPVTALQTTQAAAPVTTPAAKPKTVATFHGSGAGNTPPFTVTATWAISYAFDCTGFGAKGNFQVYEYNGSTPEGILANDLGTSKQGTSWAYDGPGTKHLNINSECDWTVKILDEG